VFARLSASNWLLAAAAAWALGVAILALAGFGGRYRLYPDDPSLVPQLPSTAVQVGRAPLGPLESYAEAANRPLFYPNRKPAQARVGNDAEAQQPLNVVLTSVIITPTLRMAIVRDTASNKSLRVREGQPLEGGPAGWKLVAVSRHQAVFESSQGRTTLDLRVFNGQGGEPPTPNGLTPQAVSTANISTMFASPPPPNAGASNIAPPAILGAAPVMPPPPPPNNDDAAADERRGVEAVARAQADAIRQRIEARRKQAQDAAAAAPPPSEKVQ
jgi:general secretion pathway protein N